MKKVISLILCIAFLASFTTAFAKSSLEVINENFIVFESYDTVYAVYMAEIENTGTSTVALDGEIELYNSDEETIAEQNYISMYPNILLPGKKGYIYEKLYLDEVKSVDEVADYDVKLDSDLNDYYTVTYIPAKLDNVIEGGDYENDYLVASVENNSEESLANIKVTFIGQTSDGKLIYIDTVDSYDIGLAPGQSFLALSNGDYNFIDYINEEGLKITDLDIIAYVVE